MTPLTDAVVPLTGKKDKALLVLGLVHIAIQASNHPELAENFMRDAIAGDDDDHLLQTCIRYVTVE